MIKLTQPQQLIVDQLNAGRILYQNIATNRCEITGGNDPAIPISLSAVTALKNKGVITTGDFHGPYLLQYGFTRAAYERKITKIQPIRE